MKACGFFCPEGESKHVAFFFLDTCHGTHTHTHTHSVSTQRELYAELQTRHNSFIQVAFSINWFPCPGPRAHSPRGKKSAASPGDALDPQFVCLCVCVCVCVCVGVRS